MTYASESARVGREPVTVVELDLDFCQLTYGTAPCTAAVGVTGDQKCFNTRRTCQDAANYDPAAKTYRFATAPLPLAQQSIPSLVKVSSTPSKIDPGRGLGLRASITAVFQDHPFTDAFGIDKYLVDRAYVPFNQGTYWGKLIARNPFYQGRTMRVRSGFLTDAFSFSNFEDREYIIEKITGPDAKGRVTVTAKDVLKRADDERSQCPTPNSGALTVDITAFTNSITLTPAGIGALEYPASGKAAIGGELVDFTRTGDVLALTRGRNNTDADTHSAGDVVQVCKTWSGIRVDTIIYELLTDFAGVPASVIDFVAWQAEAEIWLANYLLTAVIAKPTGVNKLLTELMQQCPLYVWWDERTTLIEFQAIRPLREIPVTDVGEGNEIVADSVSITDRPEERLSQIWVYYNPRNPIDDKIENYTQLYIAANLETEDATQYGDVRVKKLTSRWFTTANLSEAITVGARLLSKYKDNPKVIKLKMDAKNSSIWTGDFVSVTTKALQNPDGSNSPTIMQVLEVAETAEGTAYQYELTNSYFTGRYGFITEDSQVDYGVATDEEKDEGGFICYDTGFFLDGTEAYKIV